VSSVQAGWILCRRTTKGTRPARDSGTALAFLLRRRTEPLVGVIGLAVGVGVVSFCFEPSFDGVGLRVTLYLFLCLLTGLLKAAEAETREASLQQTSLIG
jgi:hypothetical protein